MRRKHILTAVAVFALLGTVDHSQSLAEAWQGNAIKHLGGLMAKAGYVSAEQQQGQQSSAPFDWSKRESLIDKVGSDSYLSGGYGMSGGYSGMSGTAPSSQGAAPGNQTYTTGEYKFSSPSSQSGYGPNTSDNYLRKESSGTTNSPYGGAVYGGVPTTPSADPMIKGLSRDPSMR